MKDYTTQIFVVVFVTLVIGAVWVSEASGQFNSQNERTLYDRYIEHQISRRLGESMKRVIHTDELQFYIGDKNVSIQTENAFGSYKYIGLTREDMQKIVDAWIANGVEDGTDDS